MSELRIWMLAGLVGLAGSGCGGTELPGGSPPRAQGEASVASGGAPGEAGGAPGEKGGGRPCKVVGNKPAATGKPAAYDGEGFVVHEWGTNTVVVGSDGATQRGLHHEEEDLPGFVYDRLRGGALPGSSSALSVGVKMETPVTYFYSPQPRAVKVAVDFPHGVFTQWYPAVESFYPLVFLHPEAGGKVTDPALDAGHPFMTAACQEKYGTPSQGLLSWGTVQILGPGEYPEVPEASLDTFSWSHARQVAANTVRVSGVPGAEAPQDERFLFYRGLGNFQLPVRVQAGASGALSLHNESAAFGMGTAFVVRVGASRGAFAVLPQGIGAGQTLATVAPTTEDGDDLDTYAARLGDAVTDALDATGLYHDEAVAMVNTWKHQWFRTPGLRVLYLLPQPLTEAQIPLTISPTPDTTVRVMMIRVEVISPEQEQADVGALTSPDPQLMKTHFLALGRFAEPRLRRAFALMPSKHPAFAPAQALLEELASADTSSAAGE